MSNFGLKTTTIGPFNDYPFVSGDRGVQYVTNGMTLDAASVAADVNGDKFVKAGTIVGKLASGKYAPVKYAGIPQTILNDAVADGAVEVISNNPFAPVSVEVIDPGGNSLALDAYVDGFRIVISAGTDGAGAFDDAKNTATLIAAKINAVAAVANLGWARVKAGDSGAGAVGAVIANTVLVAPTPMTNFAVSTEEANLKDGDEVIGGVHSAKFDERFFEDADAGVLNAGLRALFPTAIWI